MRDRSVLFAGLGLAALIAAQSPAVAATKTPDNPNGCQIIQRHHDSSADNGSITSSVTAGNGRVSGSSSSGGTGVMVHSGSGNGSSVATSTTTGGGGHTMAMTTNSDGSCTIYVDPGDHKESQK